MCLRWHVDNQRKAVTNETIHGQKEEMNYGITDPQFSEPITGD